MRTSKQIKAYRRNFMILYFRGVLTMIRKFESSWVRSFGILGSLNTIKVAIENLLIVIADSEHDYELTFLGKTQKDGNYECKENHSKNNPT